MDEGFNVIHGDIAPYGSGCVCWVLSAITLEVREGHFPALSSLTGQDEDSPDSSLYLKTEIQLHFYLFFLVYLSFYCSIFPSIHLINRRTNGIISCNIYNRWSE